MKLFMPDEYLPATKAVYSIFLFSFSSSNNKTFLQIQF